MISNSTAIAAAELHFLLSGGSTRESFPDLSGQQAFGCAGKASSTLGLMPGFELTAFTVTVPKSRLLLLIEIL